MILNFHPDLQEYFPPSVVMEAATPLDALKLLATQHPLNGKIKPIPVKIKQLPSIAELHDPTITEADRTFDIVPAGVIPSLSGYSGAGGDSGILNIIIGVVIIIAAVVTQQYWAIGNALTVGGATAGAGVAGMLAGAAIQIGIGLVISGLMQLLAPTPKLAENEGNLTSRLFGVRSTSEIGTPIQMVFGTYKIGFHLFSFNVESRKYSGIDEPADSPYFTGKVNENIPTANLNRFYGFVQAGDKVKLDQLSNVDNRTGFEF